MVNLDTFVSHFDLINVLVNNCINMFIYDSVNPIKFRCRELDNLLERELSRVRSEVEYSRRLIEQKDNELSKVKQQTRQLIEQKDIELNQLKKKAVQTDAQLRKEKLDKLSSPRSSLAASGDSNDFQVSFFVKHYQYFSCLSYLIVFLAGSYPQLHYC